MKNTFNTPILLICFKRYDKTLEVLNSIKKIHPQKLYVSIDGGRNEIEQKEVNKVCTLFEGLDDIDIRIRKSDINQGCKYGVYNAINWFFENEEEGIILEDDIVPYQCFYLYCEELLKKYRNDSRIACISGWSYFNSIVPNDYPYSYYFSHCQSSWGWATWRDRWQLMDLELKEVPFSELEDNLKKDNVSPRIIEYWKRIYNHRISFDSAWDYQFLFSVLLKHNKYCIQPIERFVKNIGGMDGTHPTNINQNISKVVDESFTMKHPKDFFYDEKIDWVRHLNTREYV